MRRGNKERRVGVGGDEEDKERNRVGELQRRHGGGKKDLPAGQASRGSNEQLV